MVSLYKIATGQQFVEFNSIGVELKGWETSVDVVSDPIKLESKPPVEIAAAPESRDDLGEQSYDHLPATKSSTAVQVTTPSSGMPVFSHPRATSRPSTVGLAITRSQSKHSESFRLC